MHLPADTIIERFALTGSVLPLVALAKSAGAPRAPSRPLGGWLMTYGKLGPDGGIVPTVDRDGHTVEAARQLGNIDWSTYLREGRWNDTHDEEVLVGIPSTLEFHDGTTALSKSHGKVGFWTTGHLFDRRDPASWAGLGRSPRPVELERADHFWETAHLLKGTPRPIGLSAHGLMALSPCRKRIIYAKVTAAAVCELPVNPDTTLEPLELAVDGSPLAFLRKGMVGADPCRSCRCPAGACANLLRKGGVTAGALASVTPEDLEGSPARGDGVSDLVDAIMKRHHVDRATAERWVVEHAARTASPEDRSHAHA